MGGRSRRISVSLRLAWFASLVYTVNSSIARVRQKDPVSEKKKRKKKSELVRWLSG